MVKKVDVNKPGEISKASDQVEEEGYIEVQQGSPGATIESAPLTAPGVHLELEDEAEEVPVMVPIKDANGIVIRWEEQKFSREEYDEHTEKVQKSVAPPVRLGAKVDSSRAILD